MVHVSHRDYSASLFYILLSKLGCVKPASKISSANNFKLICS